MEEEAPEGASATGTQGASSTQGAWLAEDTSGEEEEFQSAQGTPGEKEEQLAQGTPGEEEGASAQGTPGEEEEQPAQRVTLRDVSLGFLRSDRGHIVLQSGWSCLRSWAWLIGHRDRIMNAHKIPRHGVIMGAMQ